MTRLAVSGHRGLSPATRRLITTALHAEISARMGDGDLVGLTCLADGADRLFARIVLDLGGPLHVFVPAVRYRDAADSAAYMDASLRMLDNADSLLAVWDGEPTRGYGGTADVVGAARARGLPVTVVWPVGAERD